MLCSNLCKIGNSINYINMLNTYNDIANIIFIHYQNIPISNCTKGGYFGGSLHLDTMYNFARLYYKYCINNCISNIILNLNFRNNHPIINYLINPYFLYLK